MTINKVDELLSYSQICKTFFRNFCAPKTDKYDPVLLPRTGSDCTTPKKDPRAHYRQGAKPNAAPRRHRGRGKLHRPAPPPQTEVLDCFRVGDLSRRSGRHGRKYVARRHTRSRPLSPVSWHCRRKVVFFDCQLRAREIRMSGCQSATGRTCRGEPDSAGGQLPAVFRPRWQPGGPR